MKKLGGSSTDKELNTTFSISKNSRLAKSKKNWSLELLEITLHPSFGSFIRQLFGKTEEIHFVSFSWDFGGIKYAYDSYLNYVGNCTPMKLIPGSSHTYQNGGLNLFPAMKVYDSLNIALFVFNNKNSKNPIDPIIDKIGSKISTSLLSQELIELTDENSNERKEYIAFLAEQLKEEIEIIINNSKVKHISTFDFKFDIKNESDYIGNFFHLQDYVRIGFNRGKF